ncbi:hypothetical protein CHS0354_024663 [Potamilus streckersoni]|uniref:PPM-type phosphatase domain-containing protein n=1 Tax=Potamilus streckersoni TaxID=2493646 RepID=A0AAE0SVJ5_9BIVA|nr:hypothetical protein CHS0354_024663 [Potamilus streckersoni]
MSNYKIGMNLRVTEDSDQGGRRYMEDHHSLRFVKNDEGGFEFAYFGIFDGHGGAEASRYARDHLLNEITKYDKFWSEKDDDILFAVKEGFLDTHYGMWKEVDKWPKTASGLPSTSGTTASIGIIKNSKLYIGHVGDSAIVLGYDDSRSDKYIRPRSEMLTMDHKPSDPEEKRRIEESGGQVVAKAGVQRVVWNRPRTNHKGPIRRSTLIDKIPFLAVARSLGDLWSYNYLNEQFVVSPEPDVSVHELKPGRDRCLIIGSDGLWNMVTSEEAVSLVVDLEYQFEYKIIHDMSVPVSYWINPAQRLVQRALQKWKARNLKADNTSCMVVLIDPPGPRKLSILKKKREEYFLSNKAKINQEPSSKEATRQPSPIKEQKVPIMSSLSPTKMVVSSKGIPSKSGTPMVLSDIGLGSNATTKGPAKSDHTKNSQLGCQLSLKGSTGDLDDSIQAVVVLQKMATTPLPLEDLVKHGKAQQHSMHGHTSPLKSSTSENRQIRVSSSTDPNSQKDSDSPTCTSSLKLLVSRTGNQIQKLGEMGTTAKPNLVQLHHNHPAEEKTNVTSVQTSNQKCLQPRKFSVDSLKSSSKFSSIQNLLKNSDIPKSVESLAVSKKRQKSIERKNINNSCLCELKGLTKQNVGNSLSSRISLRLRRMRQKSRKSSSYQLENKAFMLTKVGVKRKLESADAPILKKIKHS